MASTTLEPTAIDRPATAAPVLTHPNRDLPASRATRVIVLLLLLGSTAALTFVLVRGWDLMEDAKLLNIPLIATNLVIVLLLLRWSRGALPIAAGAATLIAIFTGISIGSWNERAGDAYARTDLAAQLADLSVAIVVLQVLVIVAALVAFSQSWQVEVEDPADLRH